MLTKQATQFSLAALTALMLVALILIAGLSMQPATISADTVPTPVYVSGSDDALYVNYWSSSAITASAGSNPYQLVAYEYQDVQFVIDQTDVNTATIKVQWSNDNSNWSDGPNIVADNAADADGMVQVANLGRYTRMYATLANSNEVTITVKAVAK
jgi:hypothetical protein